MPVGTAASAGKMSPRNLLTTTIADELRMQLNFKAKTIGVSLKDRGAVLPVGHTATVAYWFDASSSSWVTSTYYLHELPQWLKKYNDLKRPDYFLSSPWNLLLPPDRYTSSTADDNSYEGLFAGESKPVFPHNLPQIRATDTEVIRKTPFGNTITMEVAVEAIKGEKLGADSLTDFLSVSFSSTDYVGHMYGTMAMEVEDTYIRLDRDLATLLDYVDSAIGKKNVLVFLTSDHGAAHNPVYLKDHKIPSGHLQFNFINDTLQKALAAKYGQENFIADAASDGIYLNHRLIKQKGFALPEVQQFCAGFLSGLQVFAAVFTSEDLKGGNTLIGIGLFVQRGFYEARSPDISLVIHPGWIGYSTTTGTTHGSPYDYDTHVPLIFYGWNIKHGSSAAATDICDIAPTVSGILKISHPSGSMGTPIKLLLGK
jgi:predicted AlkP superfamily pyrophosphatase or phosphodiesterase